MKKVRILLRVSSNQQLEADGDLSVQRQLVKEYIERHDEWELDKKEYFEGSNSGYKNSVQDRNVLQEALNDAKKYEYDILVAYKDDRVGRRMWEIGSYVMDLKKYGVDIYTVKDGLISPEKDDIMGQMILALRYGNAQKSSSDTGMRVKDTAQKLVQKGKFMGGKAPYGYELVLSGEISKHGRALHHLVIVENECEVVKEIYNLSLNKEFGTTKIAKTLNDNPYYRALAPNDYWKPGTITSILTNPIYAGITSYKRREKIDGVYHRLDSKDWIKAEVPNDNIAIIDAHIWNLTQEKRKIRSKKYTKTLEHQNITVIKKNDGNLALIDVAYCGYCGHKLTNGTKYNYWKIKDTGEKRASKTAAYRCHLALSGIPHGGIKSPLYKAEEIEPIVFERVAKYISQLESDYKIFNEIRDHQNQEKETMEEELQNAKKELDKLISGLTVMKGHVAEAMTGEYVLTLEELASSIRVQGSKIDDKKEEVRIKEEQIKSFDASNLEWAEIKKALPTWGDVLKGSDTQTKRVVINKIVKRIDIKKDEIVIKYRINFKELLM